VTVQTANHFFEVQEMLNIKKGKSGWIKVTEKLPTEEELVLLFNARHEELHIGWYDGQNFNWGEAETAELEDMEISHWQPLPENPTEE
jgi:hypothetical protein